MQGFVLHVCAVSAQIRLCTKLLQFLGYFSGKKKEIRCGGQYTVFDANEAKVKVLMEGLPSHLVYFCSKCKTDDFVTATALLFKESIRLLWTFK